jgi:hypothetical protein
METAMKRVSEPIAQELRDVGDLLTGMRSAKQSQIQKILWGTAAITVAFLSYSALRLYCLGQILGAEIVTCLGLLLMIPMFAILYLLGPIRGRELQILEARGIFHVPGRTNQPPVADESALPFDRYLTSANSHAAELESTGTYLALPQ